MIGYFLEPFSYEYMTRAIWVAMMVGGICAFLSCFLMLKGWSLMGDALSHSIVPGVAIAAIFNFPYSLGAFFSGALAALSMFFVRSKTRLREDAVIGIVFTSFFAMGLLIVSIFPTSVNLQSIILGNMLTISPEDLFQIVMISLISLVVLILKWKDFRVLFFDYHHAKSMGMPVTFLYVLFFSLLSGMTVAALQTVGAILVIAMIITPGATAYLFTNRFDKLITLSVFMGALTCGVGAYVSYFLDVHPGGLTVLIQTLIFFFSFCFSPRYGLIYTLRFWRSF